jgi:hypothetical protein
MVFPLTQNPDRRLARARHHRRDLPPLSEKAKPRNATKFLNSFYARACMRVREMLRRMRVSLTYFPSFSSCFSQRI